MMNDNDETTTGEAGGNNLSNRANNLPARHRPYRSLFHLSFQYTKQKNAFFVSNFSY